MLTEKQAQQKAQALAQELGTNWEPRVWENLGWHYSVSSMDGMFSVHPGNDSTYFAFLSDDEYKGCGLGLWTDNFHHKDPKEVVRHQAALALEKATALMNRAKQAHAVVVAMENESGD